MKKVELLAPAGNFDALKGVIKAGADAVYLGGTLYSARAYADNFTQDEICEGIHLAHVFGRRVYLTVNTLVKEKELDSLYQYMKPFYEEGLDGVIVQDLGVLRFLRSCFPDLPFHASTQMTITGSRGAALVKKEGISRVVPARELSLEEIIKIKEETGLEIETFVHGAMCYCYSGQCLLSSILGGRSGNRGRCAQPCRLPYETGGKKGYLLSMRDMCTIELLPELIESGIDSFKIEGRMKKPAYAAGVTAIYRKYIDRYYENRAEQRLPLTPDRLMTQKSSGHSALTVSYKVSGEDMDILRSLYIRSEIGEGYYKRHNGREMISMHSPAYRETDGKLLADMEERYIKSGLLRAVKAKIRLVPGEPACLTLVSVEKESIQVTITGDMVQEACRQPLTAEKVRQQMQKSGESPLRAVQVEVEMSSPVFLPVSSLNELRRRALSAMEDAFIFQAGLAYRERKTVPFREPQFTEPKLTQRAFAGQKLSGQKLFHAVVRTPGQLEAALEEGICRIYLDYSLLEGEEAGEGGLFARLSAAKPAQLRETGAEDEYEFYLATPYIVREKDIKYLKKIENAFATGLFTGILIRNFESFLFFRETAAREQIVLDANLYIWNREAAAFWQNRAGEFYLPVECNMHEWRDLLKRCPENGMKACAIVYGRLPVMITANCVKKTVGSCNKTGGITMLKDRYQKQFPVYTDCLCCYNVIYNSVPLSLHSLAGSKQAELLANFRLDFTVEEKQEALQVIRYFKGLRAKESEPFYKEYTTGHYKRGVD
ncbi:MAG: U32 family peptidase [Lachnospiraceae bacterium]|jgi:putative protease|nr:U32 family peptidase [Lachnospiraceae bacterium]